MAKNNTSITINGKQYDARTGAVVAPIVTRTPVKAPVVRSIDGVVGGKPGRVARPTTQHHIIPKATVTHVVKKTTATAKPSVRPDITRSAAQHVKAHTPKSSATLMRAAVKKPDTASIKRRGNVQAHTHASKHLSTTSAVTVKPKLSVAKVDHTRAARATSVTLSPRVSRFAQQVIAATEHEAINLNNSFTIPVAKPAPVVIYRPEVSKASNQAPVNDIFERALQLATSHEEPMPDVPTAKTGRSLRRLVTASAGVVAVLALGVGIFGFHANDAVKFRVAASRAGFSATRPDYIPKGFALSDINTSSGTMSMDYASANSVNGVGRSFSLTEKPMSWTSEDLAASLANSPASASFNTIEQAGRTIYVYGQNQAAWVSNGILYQLIGHGALNTQDMTKLASSM